jgi:hypothetical protein
MSPRPSARASVDGATWTAHGVPISGTAGVAQRMTAVVPVPVVAVGSSGYPDDVIPTGWLSPAR